MTIRWATSSLEYFVSGPISTSTDSDPTGDVVEFAFLAEGEAPDEVTEWTAGSWQAGGPPYSAHVLLSGTGFDGEVELDPGVYVGWVRVTDDPEIPARPVERVVMYGALSVT